MNEARAPATLGEATAALFGSHARREIGESAMASDDVVTLRELLVAAVIAAGWSGSAPP